MLQQGQGKGHRSTKARGDAAEDAARVETPRADAGFRALQTPRFDSGPARTPTGPPAAAAVAGPGSLPALVDGTLRIPHAAALRVIQLRQDYRSARVGEAGASLAATFSGEA